MNRMVENALAARPKPSGVLIPVPRYERYLFCPASDWLYSTKMSQCEYYPLQRIKPQTWNDMFEGFNISHEGHSKSLDIKKLRELKPKESYTMNPIQNSMTTNALDYKGKFLIGSIHKETGAVSFTALPCRHDTRQNAKNEAARLASKDNTKHFMVVSVTDIASMQNVVFL